MNRNIQQTTIADAVEMLTPAERLRVKLHWLIERWERDIQEVEGPTRPATMREFKRYRCPYTAKDARALHGVGQQLVDLAEEIEQQIADENAGVADPVTA